MLISSLIQTILSVLESHQFSHSQGLYGITIPIQVGRGLAKRHHHRWGITPRPEDLYSICLAHIKPLAYTCKQKIEILFSYLGLGWVWVGLRFGL